MKTAKIRHRDDETWVVFPPSTRIDADEVAFEQRGDAILVRPVPRDASSNAASQPALPPDYFSTRRGVNPPA